MSSAHEQLKSLHDLVAKSVIGQEHVVETLILGLLCNGNVLLEGLPGTAKTRSIRSLARALKADLEVDGKQQLDFSPGPIFNNLILADEINRAPAKVQSALLEAMEERQVTAAGTTRKLPDLFMVLATQNPIEQEGTYPLPEAQMDRFLFKISVDYPDGDAELGIMKLVRGEESAPSTVADPIDQAAVFAARREMHDVHMSDSVEHYLVDLVIATREPARFGDKLKGWLETGSSPRATIGLDKATRAKAWLAGRDHATPDDVRSVVHAVLRHRLILSYDATADGIGPDQVIDEIITQVAVA